MSQQNQRLIDGPLFGGLVSLAGPSIASMMFTVVFEIVDMFWVGKLGAQSVAALSTSSFYVWMLRGLALAPAIGALARVSRRSGEGNSQASAKAAASSITTTIFFSLLMMALFGPLLSPAFNALGLTPLVRILAIEYAGVFISGLLFVYLMVTGEHILRGLGDTKTPMIITGISLALNAILDPICIFLFKMGLAGASYATVVAQILGAVGMMIMVKKRLPGAGVIRLKPNRSFWQKDWLPLLGIGTPVAMSHAMFSLIYLILAGIISRFGDAPLAAIGIAHRIEAFPYFLAMGFSMATATMVGQNLGAGKADRAKESTYLSLRITTVAMVGVALIYIFFPRQLYSIFISDPQVLQHGIAYLKIIAVSELLLGFEVILEGAFSGAGDTKPPFYIIFPITMLRVPVAWALTSIGGFGIEAVWITLAATTSMKGILLFFWFRKGHWQHKQV